MAFVSRAAKPVKPKQRPLPAEVEFPKMLFTGAGDRLLVITVANVPELESALKDGWKERAR